MGNKGFFGFPPGSTTPLTARLRPNIAEQEIDMGVIELLKRPAAINPEDDHFNGNTLNGKWIADSAGVQTLNTFPGWLSITTGTKGILQPVPSGDWIIETEMIWFGSVAATGGLVMTNGTNWAANIAAYLFLYPDTLTSRSFQFQKLVNNGFSAQYTGSPLSLQSINLNHHFLRIQKSGTSYLIFWSDNPMAFLRWTTEATLGFTPTYFGFRGVGHFNYFIRR
jgi:hypothetical protein